MKRKLSAILSAIMLCALCVAPAHALEYSIDGADDYLFGRPTSDDTIYEWENPNVDRSKNTALIPPGFGTPTSYLPNSGEYLTPNLVPGALNGGLVNQVGSVGNPDGGTSTNTMGSGYPADNTSTSGGVTVDGSGFPTVSGSVSNGGQAVAFTEVTNSMYYSNGSLGTLADEGSFTIKATGGAAQFNLFLANNPSSTEQSYIISDPAYTTVEASAPFKWSKTGTEDGSASLEIVKTGPGGGPLEGAEFTLTGDRGTIVTGTSGPDGKVTWTGLPADEKFTLTETKAPEGCQPIAGMNVTLEAGRTNYISVPNDTAKGFTVKKIDAQDRGSLQGAVFVFEQIDGDYKTTGATGFDGQISFQGDELPYGSYRVWEQSPPAGYQKDTHIETVEWAGEKDVLLTFEDVRDPTLIILKVNEKGESLEGAVMDVYADGKFITSVTTNSSGEVRVTGIQKEAYIEVVEKVAPAGHVLDRSTHTIHIDPYDPAIEDDPVLTVVNQSKPSLRIIKYDRISGEKLSGITFEIYKDAELFDTKTTPESGIIELFDLEPGTYLVKEVSSDDAHIVTTTPQQIELKAGQTATQELIFFPEKYAPLPLNVHQVHGERRGLTDQLFQIGGGRLGAQALQVCQQAGLGLRRVAAIGAPGDLHP